MLLRARQALFGGGFCPGSAGEKLVEEFGGSSDDRSVSDDDDWALDQDRMFHHRRQNRRVVGAAQFERTPLRFVLPREFVRMSEPELLEDRQQLLFGWRMLSVVDVGDLGVLLILEQTLGGHALAAVRVEPDRHVFHASSSLTLRRSILECPAWVGEAEAGIRECGDGERSTTPAGRSEVGQFT